MVLPDRLILNESKKLLKCQTYPLEIEINFILSFFYFPKDCSFKLIRFNTILSTSTKSYVIGHKMSSFSFVNFRRILKNLLVITTELCGVMICFAAGPKVEITSNSTLNISKIASSVNASPNVPSLCISRNNPPNRYPESAE